MFETIGTLITIVFWAIAIFLFGGGIIICGVNLFKGNGWQRFWAIVAIILGIIAFTKLYAWLDSIVLCLILTGIVLCMVGTFADKQENTPQKEKKYGFSDALVDAYVEQETIKEATKKAIRELENER